MKLATHLKTGEKVAIKIVDKAKLASSAHANTLRREISLLVKLRHPNVIRLDLFPFPSTINFFRLYDVIESQHTIYLIMEYAAGMLRRSSGFPDLAGGELFDYIVSRKRLSEKEARNFFRQVILVLFLACSYLSSSFPPLHIAMIGK